MNLDNAKPVRSLIVETINHSSRCAHHVIPASMEATTATKMPVATTSDTLLIPCTAVSAGPVMLATAISAEKTQIWMDGPTLTWFVWRMPPTTAKR